MDRIARLLSTSERSSRILEIGASYNPIAPKADGWNTHVVDHASRDELRAKYADAGVDLDRIELVDTVWNDGRLHDAVPASLHGTFDTLIASHVIEHIPDLVGFFVSADRLLSTGGVIALAVPDRRYCFDYFKPLSTTGDALEAHATGRVRHSRRTIWNHEAYAANADGIGAWGQTPVHKLTFMAGFSKARERIAQVRDDPATEYVDAHAWMFTPAVFELIIMELGALGLINWRIATMHGPDGCEFLTFLQRGRETADSLPLLEIRRMALLQRHMQELRDQIDFALAGGAVPPGIAPDRLGEGAFAERVVRLPAETARQIDDVKLHLDHQAGRLAEVETVLGRIASMLRPLRPVGRFVRYFAR